MAVVVFLEAIRKPPAISTNATRVSIEAHTTPHGMCEPCTECAIRQREALQHVMCTISCGRIMPWDAGMRHVHTSASGLGAIGGLFAGLDAVPT